VEEVTHRIGVVPGQVATFLIVSTEVDSHLTYGSSDHLHYVQVRVFLRDAILEYFDIFDHDNVGG
jgi:hypothetical protein